MEKIKSKFYVFKTIDRKGRTMYLQHLVSPSCGDKELTMSSFPEFGWRGQTMLDVAKIRELIKIQFDSIRNAKWELCQYLMDVDTPSWALPPKKIEYENLLPEGFEIILTEKEEQELIRYKEKL